MAVKSINNILARSRVIATQMGTDANLSPLIDNRGGLRASLDKVISDVYTKAAQKDKNWRNIAPRQTIAMSAGVGTLPAGVLRGFMHQAEFATDSTSLISYIKHELDNQQTYSQLGYVFIRGDNVHYTPPDGAGAFTGNLYITVPSVPTIPSGSDTAIEMTDDIYDDVCYALAMMIRGAIPVTDE